MMIVDQLVVQHQTLRNKAAENPEAIDMNEVMALMDQVQAASAHIENRQQREQLEAILYHWNGYVHKRTGAFPGVRLADYTPLPAAEEAPNTGRITTTRPDIALPRVHWLVWVAALILFIGGAAIVLWPLFADGQQPPAAASTLPSNFMVETAVAATQTGMAPAATRPGSEETAAAQAILFATAAHTTPDTAVNATPANPSPADPVIYTVQPGDTLFALARRYGISVNEIMVMNGLASESLTAGQTLILPPPPATAVPSANTPPPPQNLPPNPHQQVAELVIRAASAGLRSGPGTQFSEIMPLSRGTFAFVVGRSRDSGWYLVQLEDGVTRGWLVTPDVGLLYPAVPEAIPIVTTP